MKLLIFFLLSIIILIELSAAFKKTKEMEDFETASEPDIGPKGMPQNKTTSCATFGEFARFNPHSILGVKWFVFYYYAMPQAVQIYDFRIPCKQDIEILHSYLDGHLPESFNWSATLVMKRNVKQNTATLLEEKGDRGQYVEYSFYKKLPKNVMTDYKTIRIKQTGDNKYLAIMDCKEHTAIIMSDLNAVPPQNKLQEEAARLGYRGRKGKSYLYQGHEWMPIPEMDEKEFWFGYRWMKNSFYINRRVTEL